MDCFLNRQLGLISNQTELRNFTEADRSRITFVCDATSFQLLFLHLERASGVSLVNVTFASQLCGIIGRTRRFVFCFGMLRIKPHQIVILADTISAVRPGARAESISAYIDRLKTLETLAQSFGGVKTAYAIQAGREVRVVVDPLSITDEKASQLSMRIRERIEDELDYPSSIRITVIREQRFVETAK